MKQRTDSGFTLVELLTVIAILGLLMTLVLTSLTRGKERANRTLCANHLRQLGIALQAYAADCNNFFPDNRDGKKGPSWCGVTVQNFWTNYLVPIERLSEINKSHVLFCPTEKWHRASNLAPEVGLDGQMAMGYFYLPHRNPAETGNENHVFNYDAAGLQGWVEKKRLGGDFAKAPIAMDQMQALLTGPGNPPTFEWFGVLGLGSTPLARLPFSNHIRPSGEPMGGNFLFEDGHVRWHEFRQISMGALGGNWAMHYRIPLD